MAFASPPGLSKAGYSEGGLAAKKMDPTSPAWRGRLFWRLQFAGWGFTGLAGVFVSTAYFPFHHAFLLILSRTIFGFIVTSCLRYFYRFLRRRSSSVWLYGILIFFVTGMLGLVDNTVVFLVANQIGVDFQSHLLQQFLWGGAVMRWLIYLLWSVLYFGLNLWLDSQYERLRTAEAESEARASELRLLRAQVNPHFLFNALNAIQAVAGDAAKARPLIQSFADYLRFSLEHQRDLQPLGAELDALKNYLNVEKVRFEDQLEYRIEADADARRVSVPIALVQPLLENAIKYGQRTSTWPLRIAISASVQGGRLLIAVTNSGKWVAPGESGSTRIGLENLRRRLGLLFGHEATLEAKAREDDVEVTVEIPIREKDK